MFTRMSPERARSYTKKRKPDGSRGIVPMYVEVPKDGFGDVAFVVDDVIAEAKTLWEFSQDLKDRFGIQRVYAIVTMAKRMQHGIDFLEQSPDVDGFIIPVVAEKVDAATKRIFFEPEPVVLMK